MQLESQVASLELCRKLKELRVEQKSYFSWYAFENPLNNIFKEDDLDEDMWRIGTSRDCSKGGADWVYSAFTVAELGELLPQGHYTYRADNGWYVPPLNKIKDWNEEYPCETEADARAKLLIHLLENGLIKNDTDI